MSEPLKQTTTQLSSKRQRLIPWTDPIFVWTFYHAVWHLVRNRSLGSEPLPVSRTTNLAFLLDPLAYYVWPHPRKDTFPTVGSILARLIVMVKNPGREARELPELKPRNDPEYAGSPGSDAELTRRYQMFLSYGDKWPAAKEVKDDN